MSVFRVQLVSKAAYKKLSCLIPIYFIETASNRLLFDKGHSDPVVPFTGFLYPSQNAVTKPQSPRLFLISIALSPRLVLRNPVFAC